MITKNLTQKMDVATLPDDIREKLAELELELSEGELLFKLWDRVKVLSFEFKNLNLNYGKKFNKFLLQ